VIQISTIPCPSSSSTLPPEPSTEYTDRAQLRGRASPHADLSLLERVQLTPMHLISLITASWPACTIPATSPWHGVASEPWKCRCAVIACCAIEGNFRPRQICMGGLRARFDSEHPDRSLRLLCRECETGAYGIDDIPKEFVDYYGFVSWVRYSRSGGRRFQTSMPISPRMLFRGRRFPRSRRPWGLWQGSPTT
jgi:hypothetical protein